MVIKIFTKFRHAGYHLIQSWSLQPHLLSQTRKKDWIIGTFCITEDRDSDIMNHGRDPEIMNRGRESSSYAIPDRKVVLYRVSQKKYTRLMSQNTASIASILQIRPGLDS